MLKHKRYFVWVIVVVALLVLISIAVYYVFNMKNDNRSGSTDNDVTDSGYSDEVAKEYQSEKSDILKALAEDESLSEIEQAKNIQIYISDLAYSGRLAEAIELADEFEKETSSDILSSIGFYDTMQYLYRKDNNDERADYYKELFLKSVEDQGRSDELVNEND